MLGSEQVTASEVPTNPAGALRSCGADGGAAAVLGSIAPLSGERQGDELQKNKSTCGGIACR